MHGWTERTQHVLEKHLAIKRNNVLTHAVTYMNLETIILSETSHRRRPHVASFRFCEMSRVDRATEPERRAEGFRGMGRGY